MLSGVAATYPTSDVDGGVRRRAASRPMHEAWDEHAALARGVLTDHLDAAVAWSTHPPTVGLLGGLTAALGMLKAGFDVTLYEKTGQFARFGGPIQFASNALSTLKAVDERLFERVMQKFTFTGTRRCGMICSLRAC